MHDTFKGTPSLRLACSLPFFLSRYFSCKRMFRCRTFFRSTHSFLFPHPFSLSPVPSPAYMCFGNLWYPLTQRYSLSPSLRLDWCCITCNTKKYVTTLLRFTLLPYFIHSSSGINFTITTANVSSIRVLSPTVCPSVAVSLSRISARDSARINS